MLKKKNLKKKDVFKDLIKFIKNSFLLENIFNNYLKEDIIFISKAF